MKFSDMKMVVAATVLLVVPFAAQSADPVDQAQFAVSPPVFLQLEITSACTGSGTEFRIINRGNKWPQTGFLRLYHADDRSLISERKLRLGAGQKVSFVVKEEISQGRPVAVWVEPEWYKREFGFDASLDCKSS
ncbi:MAG: hypothetical protein NUV50_13170 [Rhodospirillales bacterium]|nr:hypothetical protein [Rhodospirillales bacterium]